MRTRAKVASVLSSGVVLLVGWQLGQSSAIATVAAPSTASGSPTAGEATSGTGSGSRSTPSATATPATGSGTGTDSSGTDPSSADPPSADSSGTASSGSAAADGTYTGEAVPTRFGSVQVSVTISGGAITDVTALKLTDADGRSVQISNQAAPILRQEVLTAQSADVSIVSRATYTSDAYLQSVQSALDAAGW